MLPRRPRTNTHPHSLVFDRDTGKPRGYGFCEFADHATAASAVRNLNAVDVALHAGRGARRDDIWFRRRRILVRGDVTDDGCTIGG
ncbi:hypothetical protein EWM64_g8728 [Hericium alpestre]|uniref:RRM domain-containing protein n=1 Tax=Hericium alpestre TaxID=135208 RepID=A0A4Y9ZLY0_9AGAM|nr:hypothetical protein EWM64_g8728 [Hericium alpestre]